MTAVLSHSLGADRPIASHGMEAIRRASAAMLVLVEGTDEVTGSPLLQLHHYRIDDILEGHVFDDLVSEDANGLLRVDLDALHRTHLIGEPPHAVGFDPSKRSPRL